MKIVSALFFLLVLLAPEPGRALAVVAKSVEQLVPAPVLSAHKNGRGKSVRVSSTSKPKKKKDLFWVILFLIGAITVIGLLFFTFNWIGKLGSLFLRILIGTLGIGLALAVGGIFFLIYFYANPV